MPRLRRVHELLERELALAEMQEQISSQVRGEIDRNQREFLLRQQLRTIQQELGEIDDVELEIAEYREKAAATWPQPGSAGGGGPAAATARDDAS